jgi:Putative transposase
VLHTYNRRRDFHLHAHVLVPGGGIDAVKHE